MCARLPKAKALGYLILARCGTRRVGDMEESIPQGAKALYVRTLAQG